MVKDELQKLDYEKAIDYIKLLTEIRFKLLALVPIATGAALKFGDLENDPISGIFLGLLGFFVTIGIIFYDQRNTEIYEKIMHRARLLEIQMQIPPATKSEIFGGLIGGRPSGRTRKLFNLVVMWHDRGTAFIYSSVLSVWSYLITASVLAIITLELKTYNLLFLFGIPLLVAVISFWQLHKIDKPSEEVIVLKKEIQLLIKGIS